MESYFNLEYLNTFLIAAETGKLNQTAELTYRSHSAVSTQIKRLEEQVGTPLFVRSKDRLILTRGGEILMEYARKILATNNTAFQSLTGKTWNGMISIGIPTDYAELFMSKLYPRLCKSMPEYHFSVDFGRSRRIRKKIVERKLDFAIAAIEPQYEEDILLWEEELYWVCSKKFEKPAEYYPVAVFSDDCILNNHALYCLKKSALPFRILFSSPDMNNLASCVKAGAAIALLPESMITSDLCTLPEDRLPRPQAMKIGCTWNEATDHNVLDKILNQMLDYFQGEFSLKDLYS